jgi:hypothetical protein
MTADDLANRASAITGSSEYDTKIQRNRAMIAGATIGGLGGLYYGFSRKKNMLVYCGAGAVVGALLSRLLMPKD